MTLKTFIEDKDVAVKDMAKMLGVTRQAVYYLIKGGAVSPKLAAKIEKVTFGAVTRLESLYPNDK